jgi:glycosyltransferase involved in cell wall biosynthesis
MEEPWDDITRAGEWLRDLTLSESPDLIHLNTLCHGDLGWGVPTITTVHSCVLSWWKAAKQTPLPSTWLRYQEKVQSSLRNSTMLVTPSAAILKTVVQHYKIDPGDARVIHNGRDSAEFHPAEKEPIIFAVGRLWDEAKNVKTLAEAAPRLAWPVYLAGDTRGPFGGQTVLPNCTLLGQLDTRQLSGWYARTSIYVSPAKYEPFGLAILEAAISGCALVLSDIPSLREIWSDAALFFDADDSEGMESALKSLIENPDCRAEMAERAIARSRHFSQARMVESYRRTYSEAIEKYRRVPWNNVCAS